MKMQRSNCESDNVQFVQELAEVDGPFEAPININFRDLIKLELPSLVWNRGDTCPKKMKLTNTGHTVIISGKWKCERPYLTGGPLLGKYVFSQIHFHWGQDECKGSEHQICGEGFPLEMHVTHFKTEYLTQESALREKDGMVVVVYLFKLQEEPNQSLKKIINSLSCVKQPSTSHVIDPRPILSFCHPFTDDYFMYWGSVVTSTCAHILLWLICREPFGISREQVKEFRKVMDSSQQPICRNSKEIQPLHKRNVFHVNASKHLDEPLLPIKNLLGCYCRGSEDNNVKNSNDCNCHGTLQNQEDVEGHLAKCVTENQYLNSEGMKVLKNTCFANQTFFVHTTHVQSVSILLKRCESDPLDNFCRLEKLKKMKSEGFKEIKRKKLKLISQSCCFIPLTEVKKIKNLSENRNIRKNKRLFNSVKAFSQIMQSLESLKNQTFKKLKEIESINQEIKEMKPLCQNTKEKKWIRKIEKIMTEQKKFTIKSSQGCLSEIRKLTKDFNLDKFFDDKALSVKNPNQKILMSTNKQTTNRGLLCYNKYIKGEGVLEIEKTSSNINNAIHFSSETQKLVESFFEDIKDNEDIKESVKNDLNLEKIKSFYSRQGNSNSMIQENKNYITQKMFTLGNLGNRFFTEVTTEDYDMDENQWKVEKQYEEELISTFEISKTKNTLDKFQSVKAYALEEQALEKNEETDLQSTTETLIPLHRADVGILLSKTTVQKTQTLETMVQQDLFLSNEEKIMSHLEKRSDSELLSSDGKFYRKKKSKKFSLKKSSSVKCKNLKDLMCEKLLHALEAKILMSKRSDSDFSSESTGIQRMIFAKFRQSKKNFWKHRKQSTGLFRVSSKRLHNKTNCKKFEGYYIQNKKPKIKKMKSHKSERMKRRIFYDLSSTSKEKENQILSKQKWKRVTKAKFKLEIQKTKDSSSETSIENFLISPDRKRLKLESKKLREYSSKESSLSFIDKNIYLTDKETRTIITNQEKESAEAKKTIEQEYSAIKPTIENSSDELQKFTPEGTVIRSRNVSRSTTKKSLRASSAGSKLSHVISKELIKPFTSDESLIVINDNLKKEIPNGRGPKLLPKNKSLNNLSNSPEHIATYPKMVESINIKKKSNKESFIPRRKSENPKKIEERPKSINTKDLSGDISGEIYKEPVGEKDSKASNQTFPSDLPNSTEFQCKFGFFTTNSSQIDNELLPLNQVQLEKGKTLKHIDTKKFHVTEGSPTKLVSLLQKPTKKHSETFHQTNSKSFAKESSKRNEDSLIVDNRDFQTSASYLSLKNNPICRPHSAESLPSQTKTLKQKGKKRPHCSRKISKHYIRKNSTISNSQSFKKSNKAEKQLNFLNLTDEEQLKIISVNVMKYLKETLKEKNDQSEKFYEKDISLITEVFSKIKNPQTKKEKSMEKISTVDKNLDKKQDSATAVKVKDKKEEKPRHIGVLRKPKVTRTEVEIQEEKLAIGPPKPANNFIKLNKQLAGKYKKLPTSPVKKAEIKINEKSKPKSSPSSGTSKPQIVTPKKKKEEILNVNAEPKDLFSSKPPSPKLPKSSPMSPKKIPQKESQLKTPRTYKKLDPNVAAKEPGGKPTSPMLAEKSNQLLKWEPNSKTPPSSSQKMSRPKKPLNPNCAGISYLPSPLPQDGDEDQTQKKNANPLSTKLKANDFQSESYDNKADIQKDTKSNNQFEKELEYFIKLQMCLNNDLTKNLENPQHLEKPKLLHQNHQEKNSFIKNITPNYPKENFDSCIKRIITMETKDLMKCSSTCSDLIEGEAKHTTRKLETNNKNPKNVSVKKLQLFDNLGAEAAKLGKEKQEETNSDSSYDCKISITLNTNSKEGENTVQSYDLDNWLGENSNSQTTCLKKSSSQLTIMKPLETLTKKRNEGDIPIEMKEKLLEILEEEINREMAIKCGGSLVSCRNSSDWLPLKEEESDGNNQSHSTMSSCDNIEILSHISNTMRQYLTYMNQLPDNESQE